MVLLNNLFKVGAGLGTISGVLYYNLEKRKNPVQTAYISSYSNNYENWDPNWDKRDPKVSENAKILENENLEHKRKKSKACRHIIMIRHGQYNTNGKGDKERVLTDLGKRQAALTGKRLKELNLPYTRLITSTMTRAQETGRIIHKHLPDIPIEETVLLEEGAPIPPVPAVSHWKPPHSFFQDGARIEAAFRKFFHRACSDQENDTYDIIVCHANVIRYFTLRALQFPPEGWLRLSLRHASITWISVTPSGKVILRMYGDAGFMPPDALSTS